ncbi:MAG TPA: SBBP repeat-containing protein [Candidatus Saccharimonadales bacterium]|nr:SBBP repeat-containing protein [Candidatus Saccharimonadales bacterium]
MKTSFLHRFIRPASSASVRGNPFKVGTSRRAARPAPRWPNRSAAGSANPALVLRPSSALFRVILIHCAFLILHSVAASPQIAWVAKYNNGVANGNHQALKMMLDSTGNIYLSGFSANTNGGTGYATLKYAPNGVLLWSARFDSTNYPAAEALAFALDASNNVLVTGTAVTAKYATNGQLLWTAPYNGLSVATDTNCDVFLAGVASNFTTFKLSSDGSNLWSQNYMPVSTNNPWGSPAILTNTAQVVAVDSSGNAYVGGFIEDPFQQSIDHKNYYADGAVLKYGQDGALLWENTFDVDTFALDVDCHSMSVSDSAVYISMDFYPGPGFIEKLNAAGTVLWSVFDSPMATSSRQLKVDRQTNTIISGETADVSFPTYRTIKIDPTGNVLWQAYYPEPSSGGTSGARSLALDNANNIYVTGFANNNASANDIITIAYDPNGHQLWLQRYDGPGHGDDVGNAIAVDNAGNVYVAGYETETNGSTEMILIKYSPITLQRQSNGTILLQAYGSPGQGFDFQATTNLQTWLDLGATVADTNGFVQFTDTNAPSFPYRFYHTTPQ